MTQAEFLTSIEDSTSTLELIDNIEIDILTANTTEYKVRYLEEDYEGNAEIISIQYFVFDNVVYPRI